MTRGFRLAGLGVALVFAWSALLPMARASGGSLGVGQLAPSLTLHTLEGQTIDSRELRGKVVVVAFWATWCEPCMRELPLLSAYATQHRDEGLRVLAFSLDDAADLVRVRAWAARLNFPVGLLGSAWAGGYGRIWRLPVSFVIDRNGKLADNGWDDEEPEWTQARLHRVLDPLLHRESTSQQAAPLPASSPAASAP